MSNYSATVLADTPAVYWRLGETSGTNANDETANGRDGTYAGTFTLNQASLLTGDANPSCDFANGWVSNTAYDPYVVDSVRSFECWADLDTTTTAGTFFGATTGTNTRIRQLIGTTNIELIPGEVGGTTGLWTSAFTLGSVFHFVLVFDDGADEASLYIDGVLLGGAAQSVTQTYPVTGQVWIGKRPSGSPWDGRLDEVAIYEYGLTAAQVEHHYNVGKGRLNPPQRRTPRTAVSMPASGAVYS